MLGDFHRNIFDKSMYKMVDLIIFPIISCGDRTLVYLRQVWVCIVHLADLVSLHIMRRSNTKLERVDILAVNMNNYFDLRIIIFDQGFIACLMPFLLKIMLGHLIIFLSYLSDARSEEKH